MSTSAFLVSCAVLAYSGFCRLVHVDLSTLLPIRLAVCLLTVAAIAAAAGVLVWGYVPGWPAAVLSVAMAAVQLATAHLWRHGVPPAYRRSE